jgi:hypothetical protein
MHGEPRKGQKRASSKCHAWCHAWCHGRHAWCDAWQHMVTAHTRYGRNEACIHGTSGAPQQANTISWFSSTMACLEMKISPSYSAWSYYWLKCEKRKTETTIYTCLFWNMNFSTISSR